jgi:hypothetical protein
MGNRAAGRVMAMLPTGDLVRLGQAVSDYLSD